MASSNKTLSFNGYAEEAITKHTFLKIGTADKYFLEAEAGSVIMGIAPQTTAITRALEVAIAGEAKLTLGDTVARGEYLKSDANAAGVPVASDFDEVGAYALESGVVGDIISVVICKGIYGV